MRGIIGQKARLSEHRNWIQKKLFFFLLVLGRKLEGIYGDICVRMLIATLFVIEMEIT